MITAISQFANQSYGLPIETAAKSVNVTWKPTEKVASGVIPTYSTYGKQLPK